MWLWPQAKKELFSKSIAEKNPFSLKHIKQGADPGFLDRGFKIVKGVRFDDDFAQLLLKFPIMETAPCETDPFKPPLTKLKGGLRG